MHTVSRMVAFKDLRESRRVGSVLDYLKGLVAQVRAVQPELSAYTLHDIGFCVRDDGTEFNFYFVAEEAVSLAKPYTRRKVPGFSPDK